MSSNIESENKKLFTPVVRERVTDQVVKKILDLIQDTTLRTGDKLPSQRELEKLLNVSRSTLREALSGLIMMGYIESRIGQGFYVCDREKAGIEKFPDIKAEILQLTIQNIYEARAVVETDLTGLAAVRSGSKEIERLYECLDVIKNCSGSETIRAGLDFHLVVADCAGNPFLAEVEKSLISQFSKHAAQLLAEPVDNDKDISLHLEIVRAIEEHDYHKARRKAFQHIFAYVEDVDIHVFPYLDES